MVVGGMHHYGKGIGFWQRRHQIRGRKIRGRKRRTRFGLGDSPVPVPARQYFFRLMIAIGPAAG
jgi:hypothetical protein